MRVWVFRDRNEGIWRVGKLRVNACFEDQKYQRRGWEEVEDRKCLHAGLEAKEFGEVGET